MVTWNNKLSSDRDILWPQVLVNDAVEPWSMNEAVDPCACWVCIIIDGHFEVFSESGSESNKSGCNSARLYKPNKIMPEGVSQIMWMKVSNLVISNVTTILKIFYFCIRPSYLDVLFTALMILGGGEIQGKIKMIRKEILLSFTFLFLRLGFFGLIKKILFTHTNLLKWLK